VPAEQQLLTDAVNLMGLGMGTVFVFLSLLVWLTALMSRVVNHLAPARRAAVTAPMAAEVSGVEVDQTLLAVIAAAIHAHRARR
jgi:oxaloacetate decarboxylase gamma subunit